MFRIITTIHAALKAARCQRNERAISRQDMVSGAGGRLIAATTPARMPSSFGAAL
jgi:hypothetical protein